MMTEDERRQIKAFIENKPMAEAVSKALMETLAAKADNEAIDTTLDDAQYGRAVKATVLASSWFREAFASLAQIGSSKSADNPPNQAR